MNRNVYWVLELAVQPGRLNFRVRLRTNVMASQGSGHLFCMVRKRTRIGPVSSRSPCRFSSFLASH